MNPPQRDTLYLVDATSQLFRAYFAIRGLSNAQGMPTNAVFGFTTMMRKLLREEEPAYVAAAFDLGGEVFRHEAYAEYKANRPPAPEDLSVQVPYAKQACEILGVRVLEAKGYEADDVIATYTRLAREAGRSVVVVASDKDLLQLVRDGVEVLNPSREVRLDAAAVVEWFGVPPDRVVDVLALMGDSVDNIPGVPGVGEKTAVAVVGTYGDLDAVLARAERFVSLYDARDGLLGAIGEVAAGGPPAAALTGLRSASRRCAEALGAFVTAEADPEMRKRAGALLALLDRHRLETPADDAPAPASLRELKRELKAMDRGSSRRVWYSVREHADAARLSRELATLREDVPVDPDLERFRRSEPDPQRALAFYRALDFRTLVDELAGAPTASGAAGPGPAAELPGEAGAGAAAGYETIADAAGLERVAGEARAAGRLGLRAVADGPDPLRARLLGLGVSWGAGRGAWVPVGSGGVEEAALGRVLGPVLGSADVAVAARDVVRTCHALDGVGLAVRRWAIDPMVAAFLLNSERSSYSLADLAQEMLGYELDRTASSRGGPRQPSLALGDDGAGERAAEEADVVLRLSGELAGRLERAGLAELYRDIDGPLLPVLAAMERHGIRVDPDVLAGMSADMEVQLERAREEIHRLAGTEFNVDSPKQLREILFDRLGLKPGRKTAKSKVASTDAQTLELLAADHAIAGRILDYRELAKLKGTYVDALAGLIDPGTGRVHTTFHPTGAATGRLSSSDPNLQNIPVRTETGRRIRSAFVAEDGWRFLASDYSQIELRVLAHLCGDEELIAAFRAGEDIHRYTASRVFGVEPEGVTDAMRRRAKAVNFGILYGMSEARLARDQGMERSEARSFIQAYFERFARVREYIDATREQALRDGAVRTLFGRVRYFPQLHQRVHRGLQEQALRAAVNMTIQGTAADLMKMAMLRVDRQLARGSFAARILLQVHDDLLLEVPEAELEAVRDLVRRAMEGVYEMSVPLHVEQKAGRDWLEAT